MQLLFMSLVLYILYVVSARGVSGSVCCGMRRGLARVLALARAANDCQNWRESMAARAHPPAHDNFVSLIATLSERAVITLATD